jgi:predicted metal-dependent enzyme (double-stranded beta helix superfamily)
VIWRPSQATRIHTYTTWCVFGGLQGLEYEVLYDENRNPVGENDNHVVRSAASHAGDIHRVCNQAASTAISLHICGTDVSRVGSSVRRYHD